MTSSKKPLDGCIIAFAESKIVHDDFKGKKIGEMKSLITANGGVYITQLANGCTHLVVTQEQFNGNIGKVSEALKKDDCKIVSFEWLSASLKSGCKVDDTPHLFNISKQKADNHRRAISLDSTSQGDKKRPLDSLHSPQSTPAKKAKQSKDGQKVKSASINIPVDENCTVVGNPQVYIDDDGTIYDATLNQTHAGNNNNKFYRIQLLASGNDHFTWTRWGRVGECGQFKILGTGSFQSALQEFEKKFRDKTGYVWKDRQLPPKSGKYTFIERSYEDSSNEEDDELPGAGKRRVSKESLESVESTTPESKLPGPVQRLVQLIFNQQYFDNSLAAMDYDVNKMPLGKLSKRTLLQGYEVLKDLANLIGDPHNGPTIEERSNRYFSLIPHAFGRRNPPVLNNQNMIKKEIELLENLTDMQLANNIMKEARSAQELEKLNILDRQYEGLGMQEMTPIDLTSNEFKEIKDYLFKSAGVTHGFSYKIQDIFRIERAGENDRFVDSAFADIPNSDRRLLWHGSRCTNFGGILSQGLRIAPPEAPVSGYMFGKGIYLADMSTKSANYCAAYNSGNVGLLLLCEAELGKPPLKMIGADHEASEKARASSCISTWGVGQTGPKAWKDASCIHDSLRGVMMPDVSVTLGSQTDEQAYLLYNEYIVYDVAQVRLRYLLRVEIR